MFSDKGLNPVQISSLFIVWSLTVFILEVPSGVVADKFTRKNVLFIAIILKALAFIVWILSPNYVGFLIGFILWGVKSAFTSGTEEALVYDELKREKAIDNYSEVTGKMKALNLVAMIAGGFAASLLAGIGYSIILLLSITSVLISAFFIYLLPKAKIIKPTTESKYFNYFSEGLKVAWSNRRIMLIIFFSALVVGLSAIDEYYSLYLHEENFNNSSIAFWIGIIFLCGAIGSYFAHHLEYKEISLTTVLFAWGLVLALASIAPSLLTPIFIGIFVGIFYAMKVLLNAFLQHEITDKTRATTTSVGGVGAEFFALVVFAVFAFTGEVESYELGVQIISAFILFTAILIRFLYKGSLTFTRQ